MELNVEKLMEELDVMLNDGQSQKVVMDVFKVLVKVFSLLKMDNDNNVKCSLGQLMRLAHDYPNVYNRYFSVLFSPEVLKCRDHCAVIKKTLGNVGEFLFHHGDLDTCLSILYWPNGCVNNTVIRFGGKSLCKGIIEVVCRSDHNIKAIAVLRNTISKINEVLELLFREDNTFEEFCLRKIFKQLFDNAFLKCKRRSQEPILPLLIGGVVQHFDLGLVEEVIQSTVQELLLESTESEVLIAAGSCLFQWVNLPYSTNVSWIVLMYCRTLTSCRRLVPLMNILNKEMDRLCLLIRLPIMRLSSLHLYINLQLSFRNNPIFFAKHSGELASLINHLGQVKGQDAASSMSAVQKLVFMTHCLFRMHPQVVGNFSALLQAIERYNHPSEEEMDIMLLENASIFKTDAFGSPLAVKSIRGLSNLGNTCYINCIIQCLFACTSFSREVLQSPLYSGQFSKSLQLTFANLLLSKRMTLTPREVVNCSMKFFSFGLQHDCSEFLTHYLDTMSEEFSQSGDSVVSKYFHGRMKNTIECLECNTQSIKIEHFSGLPISIPVCNNEPAKDTSHDLSELMNDHFKEEMLEGDNMYLCDRCKKTVRALRSHFVVAAPEYLVIVLLRFRFDGQSHSRQKVMLSINCSRVIQLCVLDDVQNDIPDSFGSGGEGPSNLKSVSYELKAMTIHSGTSPESGHYYSLVLFPEPAKDGNPSSLWHVVDDNEVRHISPQEFSGITCGTPMQTPYVLFFERQNGRGSPPLTEKDVVPCLKKIVEEGNRIFENQERLRSSSGNYLMINRRPPDRKDDDEDEHTTQKDFCNGPRLIF